MQSVVKLNDDILSIAILNVDILSVAILNVGKLSVVRLNVVAQTITPDLVTKPCQILVPYPLSYQRWP